MSHNMSQQIFSSILISIFILLCLFANVQNNIQPVPAIYIFGDSYVDGGNTIPPYIYGVDLHNQSIPRRWTNGKTYADYIATFLGVPLVPPYNITALAMNSTTGVNYAVAGSGILPQTGGPKKENFDKQISHFNSTIANGLLKWFNQPGQLYKHLTKSIFLISFGINDYNYNYHPQNGTDHTVFATYLLNQLTQRLLKLYGMGARKFIVNNIWPLGCMPMHHIYGDVCNETVNEWVIPFNNLLPLALQHLTLNLPGFYYSSTDDFKFVRWLNYNTGKTGITNTTGSCLTPVGCCPNRDAYLYFDVVHTTQAANKLFALSCFNGTVCSPKNIVGLAGA